MSFTTRCPACGTTFRIVPDQLKISDGWVRCGHCADVFDATLFLQGEAPVAPAPVVAQNRPPAPVPVQAREPDKTSAKASAPAPESALAGPPSKPPEGWYGDSALPVEADADDGWLLPPPVAAPTAAMDDAFVDELRSFSQSPQPAPSAPAADRPTPAASEGSEAGTVKVPATSSVAPDARSAASDRGQEPAVSDEVLLPAEPSFVRQAKRRAFWRSRGVRAGTGITTLLLGLALLAQVAVHQRDQLAARFPSLSPLLAGLCEPLSCELGPVRRIESVVIDSSNLVRRLGNFYSFDLVLRNSAKTPVAVPALELSLTDTRDAVIVRRVFLPEQLPGAPTLLPPEGDLALSLRLSIADQGVASMSGYRALVFYP